MTRTPHLVIIGVAFGLASGLALLACAKGFLFSGISSCFVVFCTIVITWVASSAVAWIRRRRRLDFGWHRCLVLVSAAVLVVFGTLCWMDRRQHLEILMAPAPVPAGLQVHQGQSRLFGMYVHFSGPPEAIASLLKAKGLVEVPTEPTEPADGYGSREPSKAA